MSHRFSCQISGKFAIWFAGFGMGLMVGQAFSADADQTRVGSSIPQPVSAENFADLTTSSPFRRSVDLSDSLVLTGMARIEGDIYATLFDSESTQSYVVSERANRDGWQLVGVRGDEANLESLTAKIQVDGGEVVSIRYTKIEFKDQRGSGSGSGGRRGEAGGGGQLSQEQMDDARRAARDPSKGFRGDGFRGAPPPEIMEKLNKITPDQREELARRVMQMRNNGVGSDERRKIYGEALDRAAQRR